METKWVHLKFEGVDSFWICVKGEWGRWVGDFENVVCVMYPKGLLDRKK